MKAEPTRFTDRVIRYGCERSSTHECNVTGLSSWKDGGALYREGEGLGQVKKQESG